MSKLRQAILSAADWIEKHPDEFDFSSISIPDRPGCGTPGCALGWIATFHGYHEFGPIGIAQKIMGVPGAGYFSEGGEGAIPFYDRMDEIAGEVNWRDAAKDCANTLRLYADKYHPAAKLSGAKVCSQICQRSPQLPP